MKLRHTTRIILLFLIIFFLLQLLSGTPIYRETPLNTADSSEVHFNSLLIFNDSIIVPAKVVHRPFFTPFAIKFISLYLIGLISLSLINSIIYYCKVLFDKRKFIKKIITQHVEGNKYKYPCFISEIPF